MKVAILGGQGMLGYDIFNLANSKSYHVERYDLPEHDITDYAGLEKTVSSNDIIINCAAYTAVDRAESDVGRCHKVNAEAVGELGELCVEYDRYLVHISTDFVFGNSDNIPLSENSPTNPLGVYGATKLEGERLLLETGARSAVIRVQWTYGKNGANFISKIIDLANRLDSLKVVDDQVGSPTHTYDVARAVLCFIEKEKQPEGLFHFAAEGYVSRYDVAKFICEELNISKPLYPCTSNEFKTDAERPLNSRFDCSKIDKEINFTRPEWHDSLRSFLQKL